MLETVTIGQATLHCGDCREVLPTLGTVDAVITDPPYSERCHAGHDAGASKARDSAERQALGYRALTLEDVAYFAEQYTRVCSGWVVWMTDSDLALAVRTAMEKAGRYAFAPLPFYQPGRAVRLSGDGPSSWTDWIVVARTKAQIVWGGNYFGLPAARCWLVWDKCTGANAFADCELAWTSLDAAVRKLVVPWVGANATDVGGERPHPTLKPTRLMTWCLDKVPDAQTVLDPFMGSGTTGVACAQLGKAFTGIERERKYFDIACERIARAQAQGQLLPPEPVAAPEQQTIEL